MADNMNVTVRDPLAPRRQMPPIVIGRAGEYGATTVTFDLRGLIDRYGAGVPTLLHKRPPDDEAYIVPPSAADTETHDRTEMPDSETLVWHVGQVATSYVGNGKIELQWHPDGAAKKSAQFDVVVLGTIGNPVSEIPDAQQIYLDVMQGIADDAEDAADRAEEATEHYPKIVNGNWYVWDVTNSEWVDTGVSARGAVVLELKTVSGRQVITYNGEQITGAEIDAMYLSGALPVVEYSGRIFVPNKNCYNSGSPSARNTSFMFSRPVSAIETTFISVRYDSAVVNIINEMVYPYFDSGDDEGKVLTVGDDDTLHWETPQGGSGAVDSVNGQTGVVVLDASDVGALPDDTPIPAAVTEQTVSGWGFTKNTGTYSKPSGGIPKSDLASAVQTSLGKADTAVQPSAISGMATESYVQTQIAAIPDELPTVTASDNGKVLAVNNGEWSADSPVIVSGTDAQVANAVNDYLTQYGVPLRLSEEIKQALLDCFENVAWINDDGQTYYDALYAALYPPVDVLSISAVFTQGSAVIYDTDDLDTLKQYLVVTATMTDSTTQTVTNYTLSGALTVGTSTITVSYGGKTTTFTVTVTEAPAQEELWIDTLGANDSNANYAFAPFLLPTSTYDYNYAKAITAIELNFIRSGSVSVGYYTGNPATDSTYDQSKVHVHETLSVSGSGVNKLTLATPMTIPSGAILLIGIGTDTATFKYGGTKTSGFWYKGNQGAFIEQNKTLGINVYRQ